MSIQRARDYFRPLGREQDILEFPISSATVELAAQAAGVGTVVPDSLWYSRDDTMGVLTFVIPS